MTVEQRNNLIFFDANFLGRRWNVCIVPKHKIGLVGCFFVTLQRSIAGKLGRTCVTRKLWDGGSRRKCLKRLFSFMGRCRVLVQSLKEKITRKHEQNMITDQRENYALVWERDSDQPVYLFSMETICRNIYKNNLRSRIDVFGICVRLLLICSEMFPNTIHSQWIRSAHRLASLTQTWPTNGMPR